MGSLRDRTDEDQTNEETWTWSKEGKRKRETEALIVSKSWV